MSKRHHLAIAGLWLFVLLLWELLWLSGLPHYILGPIDTSSPPSA